MKVRISNTALGDLRRIVETISSYDEDLAEGIVEYLKGLALDIGRGPRLYSPVLGRQKVRKRRAAPYLILFEDHKDHVLILRIVHERSDWMALV